MQPGENVLCCECHVYIEWCWDVMLIRRLGWAGREPSLTNINLILIVPNSVELLCHKLRSPIASKREFVPLMNTKSVHVFQESSKWYCLSPRTILTSPGGGYSTWVLEQ